jgi:hypothetical protein
MKKRVAVLILSFLCMMLVAGLALARSSPNFTIPWDAVASGGHRMASSHYAIEGTMSQTAIGPSGSASFQMEAGYWYGIGATPPGHGIFLPIVMRLS